MKRPALKDMTLRQKIGQTGFPSPKQLLDGILGKVKLEGKSPVRLSPHPFI